MKKRTYGTGGIRALPSGKLQARFRGPDGKRHAKTFDHMKDAKAWLSRLDDSVRQADYLGADWTPPSDKARTTKRAETLADYADRWLAERDVKPRTRAHYRAILDQHILPALGDMPPRTITPDVVRGWHASLDRSTPTIRSHAYSLLRTIFTTAVQDDLVLANPCHIRGAGTTKRARDVVVLSPAEVDALGAAMPEKYRVMTLLAAWTGLRSGELRELRRKDVDLDRGVIMVRRAVARAADADSTALPALTKACDCRPGCLIGTPKSGHGKRDVPLADHMVPVLRDYLSGSIAGGRDGLLFPAARGGHMTESTLYKAFYPAREAIARPGLRWHDLRHTAGVQFALADATTHEIMTWMGHSDIKMTMHYQHVAEGRGSHVAARLSALRTSG